MQPDLKRIIRELQKETCPQRVHDKVRGRISAREASTGRLRFAILFAVAGLVLVCCLSVWRWQAMQNVRQQARLAAQTKLDHARVVKQAEGALGLLGSVLANAGADSERIISDTAVPPLRDSLEIAKNKIIHHTEL